MATSTIKSRVGIDTPETSVTLPYTASKPGIMTVAINPSTSAGGYVTIRAYGVNFSLSSANGAGNTMTLPVKQGEIVSLVSSSNVGVSYRFFPIF